jgi:oligopeptidase B
LENIKNVWYSVGFQLQPFTNEIEYFSLKYGVYILRINGLKVIYTIKGENLFSFYGNIYTHPLNGPKFFIDFTDSGISEFSFENAFSICSSPYCSVKREFAKSYDGTRVPYLLAKPFCEIKGLMVISYGAYGIPTNLSTRRWMPYLRDGWMLCFAMVRGGGDVNRKWAFSAQTVNKVLSCEDLEACIYTVQKKYKIAPSKTCIYGRSAGGYLIGMAVSRGSGLFKMVYTEVPYVDVLTTTTNPSLPLTPLEYNEFGNPARSIYEFQEILKLSPVDTIVKPPDLFVIIHTSDNDSQVYAYESYKWLDALGNTGKKLLYLNEKKGHFITGSDAYENFSDDFFLLKSFRDVKT